jgi:type IV pilus biogenesis protein PilP
MFSRKVMVAVFAVAFASSPAFAAAEIAEEIRQINEQIALMSAKFKELELRAQIATKKAEIERIGASGSGSTVGEAAAEIPVVRGIEGVDGRLKATLAYTGRIQQTVSQGEKIRGGWTVTQIDVSAVTLSRGTEKLRLGFGNEPPAAALTGPGGPGQIASPR